MAQALRITPARIWFAKHAGHLPLMVILRRKPPLLVNMALLLADRVIPSMRPRLGQEDRAHRSRRRMTSSKHLTAESNWVPESETL